MSRSSLGRLGLLFVSLLGLMSLFSGSAFASGPPIVSANAAGNLTLNTATASGTVDKNGAASASVKIEYGKTKLYGKSVTLSSVTSAGAVPVSTILVGLEPITTYHYRISATNSFGTTVSEDILFEMLLQWKVEGKPVSELGSVQYSAVNFAWGLTGEGTTKGGTAVKVTCAPSFTGPDGKEDWARGVLGSSYHFPFKGCKTFLNGNESKPCTPQSSLYLDLNAVLVPTKVQALELGEECSIGSSLALPSGYRIGAMSEAKEQAITLTEQVGYMTFTISNPTWKVVAKDEGKKFGIS